MGRRNWTPEQRVTSLLGGAVLTRSVAYKLGIGGRVVKVAVDGRSIVRPMVGVVPHVRMPRR